MLYFYRQYDRSKSVFFGENQVYRQARPHALPEQREAGKGPKNEDVFFHDIFLEVAAGGGMLSL